MKKRFFLLVLLLCGYIAVQQITQGEQKKSGNQYDRAQEKTPEEEYRTIEIAKDQVYQGNLLLVNKEHPVQQEARQLTVEGSCGGLVGRTVVRSENKGFAHQNS